MTRFSLWTLVVSYLCARYYAEELWRGTFAACSRAVCCPEHARDRRTYTHTVCRPDHNTLFVGQQIDCIMDDLAAERHWRWWTDARLVTGVNTKYGPITRTCINTVQMAHSKHCLRRLIFPGFCLTMKLHKGPDYICPGFNDTSLFQFPALPLV